MSDEWLDSPHARLRVRSDGVAEIRHKDGVHHTLAIARAQLDAFRERLDGAKAPLLVVVGSGFRQDEDARELLLRAPAMSETFTRAAMVLGGRIEQVAVSVFLRVQRTAVPVRAFHDEAEALRWLREGWPREG